MFFSNEMTEHSLTTLEFGKLLALVAANAQTPMGAARIFDLKPFTSRIELGRALDAISETIRLSEEKQVSWSFSGLSDPTDAVAILRIKGASLEPERMLEIARICNQVLFARSSVQPEKEFAPVIWAVLEPVPPSLLGVIERINKKLLPSGELDDSASPELARLRREINLQRGRLQKSLESAMRGAGDAIQDAIVTMRNDRYVIPVKSDFRGKVGGVAHGFSSSGATVFIEPLDAIEANNELQNLKGKEEREIAQIIFALTEMLRENLIAIEAAASAAAELDFIKTKVAFARSFAAVVPEINDDATLDLVDARHPLLENNIRASSLIVDRGSLGASRDDQLQIADRKSQIQEIVPVSFRLTRQNPVMIISGANAGGKTVVLKTAGLLGLMAISGLPVPAREARIPFYKSVLADIGDNQSLSANLSTFSSHISNIAEILEICREPSLVLLDEVGTGTDPDEGSALGVAIVDFLRRERGAQVIASTHYRGLKIYAANDESVINASVEFNEKTLQPTYRLLVGLAGASSGIEIARRFGIRDDVIANARQNLDDSAREAENYLQKLAAETRVATDLRAALEEEREATAQKYALIDIEARKKEKERRREFERELARTIEEFDRQSKAFLSNIEDKALRNKLDKERTARKAELNRAVVAKIGDAGNRGRGDAVTLSEANDTIDAPIIVGARVKTSFGSVGTVEKIDKEMAEVLVGSMRLREKVANLQVVAEAAAATQTRGEKLQAQAKNSTVRLDTEDKSAELNLIGKTTADAEYEIDRFLDEAYLAALPKVRIIHGFGTGALKNFVHHFLKGHPHVKRYAFASQEQGGHGATIAELKQ